MKNGLPNVLPNTDITIGDFISLLYHSAQKLNDAPFMFH
jgi:hypothetical protein